MLSHKKLFLGFASFGFLAALVTHAGITEIVGYVAYAAQENTSNVNMYHNAAAGMSLIITGMEFLTYLLISLLSALLDPNFILGIINEGGGQEILRSIWELSRDVMNVIFAFMLIIAALYMVAVPQKGAVNKQIIVKFIVGVLLVNFSWFFPRVILDIANVATATVYQIPLLTMDTPECKYRDDSSSGDTNVITTEFKDCEYIKDVKLFSGAERALNGTGYESKVGGLVAVKTETMTEDQLRTPTGILYALVYNHGRLGKLTYVLAPTSSPTAPNDLSDSVRDLLFFIIHTIFVLAMESMLFFPLIAMVAAFILRMIVIWLTVAFMPFMFISFVLNSVSGFNTMDIFNHYVKAAFLPAVVGIPIAAGFIFINAAMHIAPPPGMEVLDENTGPLLMGVNSFWHILFLITCYMIIWKGFFFALSKYDNMYAGIASSVQALGSKIGGGVLRSPLSIPLPVPKGGRLDSLDGKPTGKASIGSLLGAAANPSKVPATKPSSDPSLNASKIDNALSRDGPLHKDLESILSELKAIERGGPGSNETVKQRFNDSVRNIGIRIDDVSEIKEITKNLKSTVGKELHSIVK